MQALKEEGVEYIFGYPGGTVIPLFDEFLNHDIKLIRVRHEQAAAHAADGYARVSGKAAVVVVTSGPGATNTITGIATAAMDSIPMVIISGQVKTPVIGTDAFQETNVLGVSRPVTKHNYLVKSIDQLPKILKEAFYISQTGRPGPVLIDIPVDIQMMSTTEKAPKKIMIPGYHLAEKIRPEEISNTWDMIAHSSRPMIYAGGGVNIANAADELTLFAKTARIPVGMTLLGLGGFPEGHELSLGMMGMHGQFTANSALSRTDLVITIGARFDDRVTGKVETFLKQSKIIHIDIDPSVINKIKPADIGIVGDVKDFLSQINKIAKPLKTRDWLDELKETKKKHPLPNFDETDCPQFKLRPEYIIGQFSRLTKGEATVVTDVGQHQMFIAQHFGFKQPRSILTSGGLGTMGYCLPASIGAALFVRDRPVIAISGDGGIQMNIQELATIKTYGLPVIIVIFNNGNLGMVKQWQDFFWKKRRSGTLFNHNPDFIKLGEAYGIDSFRATKKEEVVPLITKALKLKKPVLLEFAIDEDAYVFPMIPPGGDLSEIIEGAGK